MYNYRTACIIIPFLSRAAVNAGFILPRPTRDRAGRSGAVGWDAVTSARPARLPGDCHRSPPTADRPRLGSPTAVPAGQAGAARLAQGRKEQPEDPTGMLPREERAAFLRPLALRGGRPARRLNRLRVATNGNLAAALIRRTGGGAAACPAAQGYAVGRTGSGAAACPAAQGYAVGRTGSGAAACPAAQGYAVGRTGSGAACPAAQGYAVATGGKRDSRRGCEAWAQAKPGGHRPLTRRPGSPRVAAWLWARCPPFRQSRIACWRHRVYLPAWSRRR